MKKALRFLASFVLMLTAAVPVSVLATTEPYQGYQYDCYGASVASLNGYTPYKVFTAADMGIGSLVSPKDFYVDDASNEIYLLDSGRGSVIVLNDELRVVREISSFTLNGEASPLASPSSVFVTEDKTVVIADTDNMRIIKANQNGEILSEITRPESSIYPAQATFTPLKVLCDTAGKTYALLDGIYQGAAVFNKANQFERFYGSNKVSVSVEVLADLFWKRIMNQTQREGLSRYVPVEFAGMDIDQNGFVTTVTKNAVPKERLRKLNSLGENIISTTAGFGDLEQVYDRVTIATTFIDVAVNAEGYTYALDSTRGRVFEYDKNYNFVFAFGGISGGQAGTFKFPVAVETKGDNVLVLDSEMKTITEFQMTSFGQKVHGALALYNEGYYKEAFEPWKEIIRLNNNYTLAHTGLGDGYYMLGEYQNAMEEYKQVHDQQGYLKAFREYRNALIRENFKYILLAVAVLVAGSLFFSELLKRKRRNRS